MIRFNALGGLDLRGAGAPDARAVLTQPRVLALLAYLAIARPRGFHRRDSLVGIFWPELGHEASRNALRQVVHRLRRSLGESAVVNRGAEELGTSPELIWCDVIAFERALDQGKPAEALEQYRGDLLPGFFISDAPLFERWLDEERARLRQRAGDAAWLLADEEASRGAGAIATHWARQAAAFAPDDENAARRLIALLAKLGDRAAALRAYESLERHLREEFDVEPAPETQSLIAPLQARRASPPRPATAAFVPDAPSTEALPLDTSKTRRQRSRGALWLAIPLVSLAVIATVAFVQRAGAIRPTTPSPRALAVFPFAVRGENRLDYLREGMVDLLSAKLNTAPGVRALDPRSVLAATSRTAPGDLSSGSAMAKTLGATWFVTGEIVEIAGRLQISATMYETGQLKPFATSSVTGETTSLFELVDQLTGRLLAGIVVGRDTAITRLAAMTTRSLPALEAFLRGESALRAGQEPQAAMSFLEAANLDTTFALAQYRLALTATWTPVAGVNATEWSARAARNAGRLPPLARDLLTAYSRYRLVDAGEAERLYRNITRASPENVEAWLMLGETLFHFNALRGRSTSDSRQAWERVLELDPTNAHAMIHLARLDAHEGRVAQLDSLATAYATHHSDADRLLEMRTLRAYVHDDSLERARVARDAAAAGDVMVVSLLQAATIYAENPAAGGDMLNAFSRGDRDPYVARYGHRVLTEWSFARGNATRQAAMRFAGPEFDDGWALETEALLASDPFFPIPVAQIMAVRNRVATRMPYPSLGQGTGLPRPEAGRQMQAYLLALLSLRLSDTADAQRRLTELQRDTGRQAGGIAAELARGIRAELSRSRGDLPAALAELDHFPFLDMNAIGNLQHFGLRERFLRAEVLRALHRDEEALLAYDALHSGNDLPYAAAEHLRRAEINQRLGRGDEARFHYGRAAALWKDADPGFQLLLAQSRLPTGR